MIWYLTHYQKLLELCIESSLYQVTNILLNFAIWISIVLHFRHRVSHSFIKFRGKLKILYSVSFGRNTILNRLNKWRGYVWYYKVVLKFNLFLPPALYDIIFEYLLLPGFAQTKYVLSTILEEVVRMARLTTRPTSLLDLVTVHQVLARVGWHTKM